MKPVALLTLPALTLAAATPAKVEERQIPGLPIPLNPTCVLRITGILDCVPSLGGIDPNVPLLLSQLVGLLDCSGDIVEDVLGCLI